MGTFSYRWETSHSITITKSSHYYHTETTLMYMKLPLPLCVYEPFYFCITKSEPIVSQC